MLAPGAGESPGMTSLSFILCRLVDLPRIPHNILVRPRTDLRSLSLTKDNIGADYGGIEERELRY